MASFAHTIGSLIAVLVPIAFVVYVVVVAVVIINEQRDPTRTLTWLLLIYVLPVIGLVMYFFFGRNFRKARARSGWWLKVAEAAEPVRARIHDRYASDVARCEAIADQLGYSEVVRIAEAGESVFPLPAYDVRIMPTGAEKFAQLKIDLADARDTINLMYFIWERDQLTREIIDILIERCHAGVEVRVLNDFVGSITYRKDQLKELRRAGGKVSYDVRALGQANYRNHRKIVVIDGVKGYTGGANMGQEYIDGGKRYASWRDTHVAYTGPAVAGLQALFARRWLDVEKENLFTERFFPPDYPAEGRMTPALTVSTGVDSIWEVSRRAHIVGMGEARERIWIQSPYFVPTTDIQIGMVNAALSGMDVRLMMTGVPDKRSAWYAANTYMEPLLEAGGRVFHYTAGFFHPKTMTLDGKVCVIGTQNMDVRSLELHKELMVWFFDEQLARAYERIFEADMLDCREITLDDLRTQSGLERFRDSAFRLASNLL